MTYNFCTLFDRNYFYKGLAMYNSLRANCSSDFNLWVLCMDDLTYDLLLKMNLSNIKLVTLREFESPELLKIKKDRNVAEYSWTCASNFMWWLLQNHQDLEELIYLDADLYFFGDPKILIDELADNDVLITEHRYTKKYDQSLTSGKYCVQFMIFKNNSNGLLILDWWRMACLNWCFAVLDNNRFGDQKYLDDWLSRFQKVHELKNLGGGVAPWNVQQYVFKVNDNKVFGCLQKKSETWLLIFYHFHGFYLLNSKKYLPNCNYELSKNMRRLIYKPYFKALGASIEFVKKYNPDFDFGYKQVSFKDRLTFFIINFSLTRVIFEKIKLIKR